MRKMLEPIAWIVGVLGASACATDPAPDCSRDGGAACFRLPDAPVAAYQDGAARPVSLGCGALAPTAIGHSLTVTGLATDPLSKAPVENTQLVVFDSSELTSALETTTTDAMGRYTITLPAETPGALHLRIAARGYLPGVFLQHRYDTTAATISFDVPVLTPDDADTEAGLVHTSFDHNKAGVGVIAHDCARSRLEHAVIVISSQPGTRAFLDGVVVAYTADAAPIPELFSVQSDTSQQGMAGAVNVPAGQRLFAQTWGFPDEASVARGEAGLVLLDELPFTAEAESANVIELYAR